MNSVSVGFIDEQEKLAFPSSALARSGIGAAVGGISGALSDKNHRVRNALVGAGLGGAAGYGVHKALGKPATAEQAKNFINYKENPFHPDAQIPFKKLTRSQKMRVVGGIAANTAMGVIPTVAAAGYGVNKLRGKDSYKKKYEDLVMQQRAHERAMQHA